MKQKWLIFRAECTYCIKTLNWDQVFKDVTYDFNFHFIAFVYDGLYKYITTRKVYENSKIPRK